MFRLFSLLFENFPGNQRMALLFLRFQVSERSCHVFCPFLGRCTCCAPPDVDLHAAYLEPLRKILACASINIPRVNLICFSKILSLIHFELQNQTRLRSCSRLPFCGANIANIIRFETSALTCELSSYPHLRHRLCSLEAATIWKNGSAAGIFLNCFQQRSWSRPIILGQKKTSHHSYVFSVLIPYLRSSLCECDQEQRV